jgi:putative adhesin
MEPLHQGERILMRHMGGGRPDCAYQSFNYNEEHTSMNIRTCRLMLLIFLNVALFARVAWSEDQGREFHWTGKLAAEQLVLVKGVNGNIDAEGGAGDQVEITAEKSGPDADRVKIQVASSGEGIVVCPIYPGSSESCSPNWRASHVRGDDTKVHFIIHMPKNVRFSGQDINGDVNAKGMSRFVRGQSVNGSVRIATSAWAEAETVNGSIEVKMGNAAWSGTLAFKTVNGSVRVELPDDLNADVKFKSLNGRISSDFPITISGSFVGQSAKGRIGNGGRELSIETVNGSVQLKKAGAGI